MYLLCCLVPVFALQGPAKLDKPTKFAVWKLGTNYNLALALTNRSNNPKVTEGTYAKAKRIGELLGVQLPDLPGKLELPALLGYFKKSNDELAERVEKKYDAEHGKLVLLSSRLFSYMLVSELEADDINKQFMEGFRGMASDLKLPEDTYQPLMDAIKQKANFDVIKREVLSTDDRISKFLDKK